jgi:hypothetical protein
MKQLQESGLDGGLPGAVEGGATSPSNDLIALLHAFYEIGKQFFVHHASHKFWCAEMSGPVPSLQFLITIRRRLVI